LNFAPLQKPARLTWTKKLDPAPQKHQRNRDGTLRPVIPNATPTNWLMTLK